jgi:hypothetical protein
VKITRGELFVAEQFVGWQEAALLALQQQFSAASKSFPKDAPGAVIEAIKGSMADVPDKQLKQQAMPFIKFKMDEAVKVGAQVGCWRCCWPGCTPAGWSAAAGKVLLLAGSCW